tara:strand:- start:215 stop:655 length:441 start_codon:yes stop_codon:yes gene_type:complete
MDATALVPDGDCSGELIDGIMLRMLSFFRFLEMNFKRFLCKKDFMSATISRLLILYIANAARRTTRIAAALAAALAAAMSTSLSFFVRFDSSIAELFLFLEAGDSAIAELFIAELFLSFNSASLEIAELFVTFKFSTSELVFIGGK